MDRNEQQGVWPHRNEWPINVLWGIGGPNRKKCSWGTMILNMFLCALSGKHESRKPTMLENDIEVWYRAIDRFYYVFTVYLFYSYRAFVPKVHEPSCVCILHTKYSHAETSMSSMCKHPKDLWVISATPQFAWYFMVNVGESMYGVFLIYIVILSFAWYFMVNVGK